MTRYRVPVSDQILEQRDYWKTVEGFRLISVDGTVPGYPDVAICTFEDDLAPASLEGQMVEPVFRRDDTGVHITERRVVNL